jgi:hydrogenase maturation protein HypF
MTGFAQRQGLSPDPWQMKSHQRLRVVIKGAVQGVGFRPFVYKLAVSLELKGWIINSSQGVYIEVDGENPVLETFLLRLEKEKPGPAFIQSLESSYLDAAGFESFEIRKSSGQGEKTVLVLPDIATCPQCLTEIFDPANRRYLYPFTNCTLCGPRYTIISALPYDRPFTSMKGFPMCPECKKEYENPDDRRFHAQPNACPVCGPSIYAHNTKGEELANNHEAMLMAAEYLRKGKIVAIKGLGGFHLMVDAGRSESVDLLRKRKRRNEKPFAVMMQGIDEIQSECRVDELERRLLLSSEAPIVLLDRLTHSEMSKICNSVAPHNPTLGVMLPYTPLHHVLLRQAGVPLVATSGNLSDEPICIDEKDALNRLDGLADLFLFHNRPILRPVDDSVARIVAGREMLLRRARGYAPLPVMVKGNRKSVLAVGGHQKNTVALQVGSNAMISQHHGDLETEQSYEAFQQSIDSLKKLFEAKPEMIYCDSHEGYMSTQYARESGIPCREIQHHHAHIASCMAENQLTGRVLGVAWDGTGAGPDNTIWGGEFLVGDEGQMERTTCLRRFRLPGSSQAIKEPARSALGVLFETFGSELMQRNDLLPVQSFKKNELNLLLQMLKSGFNSPLTSSAGRLFDAVSSLIGLRQKASFEGQGAMELEFALSQVECYDHYLFNYSDELDWIPMIREIIQDLVAGVELAQISAKFHNTMTEMILSVAERTGEKRVVLSGGCFQNRYLTERTVSRLKEEGFLPYWHQRIPPNDGGISLGQIYAGKD